jgi:tetratricopeptide (TPR) repeat protein
MVLWTLLQVRTGLICVIVLVVNLAPCAYVIAEEIQEWKQLYDQGVAALRRKEGVQAINCFTSALAKQPPNDILWSLYLNRAIAFGFADNLDAVLEDSNRALQSPKPEGVASKIHMLRAMPYLRRCRPDLALKETEMAVASNPSDIEALIGRAVILLSHFGSFERVMADLNRAVELANLAGGKSSAHARAYAFWKRAEAALAVERYDLADSDIRSALSIAPGVDAYLGRALIKLAKRKPSEARLDCELASKLPLSRSDVHDMDKMLGRIAFLRRQDGRGKEALCSHREELQC